MVTDGDTFHQFWLDYGNAAKADNFYDATFVGGAAAAELKAPEAAGGDPCRTLKPAMVSFLTRKTEEFHANIANPDINKAMAFSLDATKQIYLEYLTQAVSLWDDGALGYLQDIEMQEPGNLPQCEDSLGPDEPLPATTRDHIDKCPEDLARASFNFDLSIFSISVNCEKVSVGTSAPGFGPFAKFTVAFTGDVTVMAGGADQPVRAVRERHRHDRARFRAREHAHTGLARTE